MGMFSFRGVYHLPFPLLVSESTCVPAVSSTECVIKFLILVNVMGEKCSFNFNFTSEIVHFSYV
jgi:hypothetical protein